MKNYCNAALSPFLCKNQSNHCNVNVVKSLARDKIKLVKSIASRGRDTLLFLEHFLHGVKHGQMHLIHSFLTTQCMKGLENWVN